MKPKKNNPIPALDGTVPPPIAHIVCAKCGKTAEGWAIRDPTLGECRVCRACNDAHLERNRAGVRRILERAKADGLITDLPLAGRTVPVLFVTDKTWVMAHPGCELPGWAHLSDDGSVVYGRAKSLDRIDHWLRRCGATPAVRAADPNNEGEMEMKKVVKKAAKKATGAAGRRGKGLPADGTILYHRYRDGTVYECKIKGGVAVFDGQEFTSLSTAACAATIKQAGAESRKGGHVTENGLRYWTVDKPEAKAAKPAKADKPAKAAKPKRAAKADKPAKAAKPKKAKPTPAEEPNADDDADGDGGDTGEGDGE